MRSNVNDPVIFFEEEMAWRKGLGKRDTGREILESMSYSEVQELLVPLLENRIDVKKSYDKQYKQVIRYAKKYYAPETFEFDFAIKAVWALMFQRQDYENHNQLEVLEKYWLFNESRRPATRHPYHSSRIDFEILISEAKQVPIESLCKTPFKKSGTNTLRCLCPFHTEKTPSFTIFTHTNTFFCFGCKAQGDSIAFYQKFYGVDFVESVKKLTGQY